MITKFDDEIVIPEDFTKKWQDIVDLISEITGISTVTIMKLEKEQFEITHAGNSEKSAFKPHDTIKLNQEISSYCEVVANTKQKLEVNNALEDEYWKRSSAVRNKGLISYLGFPLLFPNKEVFGTLCMLDNKENKFDSKIDKLLNQFSEVINTHLELIMKNKQLEKAMSEIKTLSGLLPICSYCKKVRDDSGYWENVDSYIHKHSNAELTHSICNECMEKYFSDEALKEKK